MTILDSKQAQYVAIKLEFQKPFVSTNKTEFTLQPTPGGTRVVWSMDGHNNFMSKAFSIFMSMDSMVGKDFEHGLVKLNTAAQSDMAKRKKTG